MSAIGDKFIFSHYLEPVSEEAAQRELDEIDAWLEAHTVVSEDKSDIANSIANRRFTEKNSHIHNGGTYSSPKKSKEYTDNASKEHNGVRDAAARHDISTTTKEKQSKETKDTADYINNQSAKSINSEIKDREKERADKKAKNESSYYLENDDFPDDKEQRELDKEVKASEDKNSNTENCSKSTKEAVEIDELFDESFFF